MIGEEIRGQEDLPNSLVTTAQAKKILDFTISQLSQVAALHFLASICVTLCILTN